jgi:hypothetical protein
MNGYEKQKGLVFVWVLAIGLIIFCLATVVAGEMISGLQRSGKDCTKLPSGVIYCMDKS